MLWHICKYELQVYMFIHIFIQLPYMNNLCILIMISYYHESFRHVEGLICENDFNHGMWMVDEYRKNKFFGNSFYVVRSVRLLQGLSWPSAWRDTRRNMNINMICDYMKLKNFSWRLKELMARWRTKKEYGLIVMCVRSYIEIFRVTPGW